MGLFLLYGVVVRCVRTSEILQIEPNHVDGLHRVDDNCGEVFKLRSV